MVQESEGFAQRWHRSWCRAAVQEDVGRSRCSRAEPSHTQTHTRAPGVRGSAGRASPSLPATEQAPLNAPLPPSRLEGDSTLTVLSSPGALPPRHIPELQEPPGQAAVALLPCTPPMGKLCQEDVVCTPGFRGQSHVDAGMQTLPARRRGTSESAPTCLP